MKPALTGLRGLMLDLDGTVYQDNRLIAGAAEDYSRPPGAWLPASLCLPTPPTKRAGDHPGQAGHPGNRSKVLGDLHGSGRRQPDAPPSSGGPVLGGHPGGRHPKSSRGCNWTRTVPTSWCWAI